MRWERRIGHWIGLNVELTRWWWWFRNCWVGCYFYSFSCFWFKKKYLKYKHKTNFTKRINPWFKLSWWLKMLIFKNILKHDQIQLIYDKTLGFLRWPISYVLTCFLTRGGMNEGKLLNCFSDCVCVFTLQ